MQESGPGSSDIHSVLNPNINRSSGFINKNQTQLYKSKMYVRLWVTQPWQWDIFQTTLTPDIGSKKTFTPSHCLNESHTPSEKSKQKPTNLAHVQTVLQADNFYPLITDILQKNNQYPKNTKKIPKGVWKLFSKSGPPVQHHWDQWGPQGRKLNCIPWWQNFHKLGLWEMCSPALISSIYLSPSFFFFRLALAFESPHMFVPPWVEGMFSIAIPCKAALLHNA